MGTKQVECVLLDVWDFCNYLLSLVFSIEAFIYLVRLVFVGPVIFSHLKVFNSMYQIYMAILDI